MIKKLSNETSQNLTKPLKSLSFSFEKLRVLKLQGNANIFENLYENVLETLRKS